MENIDSRQVCAYSASCMNSVSDSFSRSNAKAKLIGRIYRNMNRKSVFPGEPLLNHVFSNRKGSSKVLSNEMYMNRSELAGNCLPAPLNQHHQANNVETFNCNESLNVEEKLFEPTSSAEFTMKVVINKNEVGKSSSAEIPEFFPQSDQQVGKSWFTFTTGKKLYYPLSIVRLDDADSGGSANGTGDIYDSDNSREILETSHMKLSITIRSECSDDEEAPEDFTAQTSALGGIFWFMAIRSVHVSGRVLIHFSCPDAPQVRPLIFRVPIIPQSDPRSLSTQRTHITKAADPVPKKRKNQQNCSTENLIKTKIPKASNSGRSLISDEDLYRNKNQLSSGTDVDVFSIAGYNHTNDATTREVGVGNALSDLLKFDWGKNFDHTICGHFINDTYSNCRYRKYTCTRCDSRLYNKSHALQHVAARQPPSMKSGNKVASCPNPVQAVKELILDYWAKEDDRMHKDMDPEIDVARIFTNSSNISPCSRDPIFLSQDGFFPLVGNVGVNNSSISHTTTATAMGSSVDLNTHSSSNSVVSNEKDLFIDTEVNGETCHDEGSQSPQSIVSTETVMQLVQYEPRAPLDHLQPCIVTGCSSAAATTESLQTPPKTGIYRPVTAYTKKLAIHTGSIDGMVSSHCIPSHFQQSQWPLSDCGTSWFSFANSSSETLYYPVRMGEDVDSGDGGGGGGVDSRSTGKVETIPHAKVSLTIRSECSDEEEAPEDFTTQTSALGGIYWFLAIRSVHVSGRVLIHFSCPDAPQVRPLIFRVPIIPLSNSSPLPLTHTCSQSHQWQVSASTDRHRSIHQVLNIQSPEVEASLSDICVKKDVHPTGDRGE